MAFLKGIKKVIEVPVHISIPVLGENDEELELNIEPIVQYKRFTRSEARKVQVEIAKISQEASAAFESGDVAALFGERLNYFDDLMRDAVKGWRKMPGGEDEDVPFSTEALEEAIEDPSYYAGFMTGMRKALGWADESASAGSEGVEGKN